MRKCRMVKLMGAGALLSAFLIFSLLVDIKAEEAVINEDMLTELDSVIDSLPDDVKDRLPEEMDSGSPDSIGDGVVKMTGASYILNVIKEILGIELTEAAKLFAKLVAVMLFAGIFGTVKNSLGESAVPSAVRFCTVSAAMAIILHSQINSLERVKEYFECLNSLMLGMIPITGSVWAMGGNVSTASVGTATMYSFLNISQWIFTKTALPISAIGSCLAFCNGISPDGGMKRISAAIRKTYVFLLGAVMTLFTAVLTAQTTITAAADSTAARTAKFVSSAFIPIVGGSVGDSLRTVAASVQYLKSVLGIGGIGIILIMALPVLLSLLLTRLVLSFSGSLSEFFNCSELGAIFSEMAEVYAGIIAAVTMSGIMFILAFFIFIKTAVAVM